MKHLTKLLALVLMVTLAACGDPANPQGPLFTQEVELRVPEGSAAATQARLTLWDPNNSAVTTSGTMETLGEGLYGGPISNFGGDGKAIVVLPNGEDLPAEVLSAPADFMSAFKDVPLALYIDPGCAMEVSDPSARVTKTALWFIFGVPNIFVHTASDWTMSVAGAAIGPDEDPGAIATWIYATKDVNIATPAEGCSGAGATYFVDVALEKGWNSAGFTILGGGDTSKEITLQSGSFDKVLVSWVPDV